MRTLFRDKGNFVGTATRHVFRGGRGIHIRYWRKSTNLTTYKSMKKKFRNVKSKIFLKYQGKVKFVNASFVFSIFCFIFNHTFAFVVLSQILIWKVAIGVKVVVKKYNISLWVVVPPHCRFPENWRSDPYILDVASPPHYACCMWLFQQWNTSVILAIPSPLVCLLITNWAVSVGCRRRHGIPQGSNGSVCQRWRRLASCTLHNTGENRWDSPKCLQSDAECVVLLTKWLWFNLKVSDKVCWIQHKKSALC